MRTDWNTVCKVQVAVKPRGTSKEALQSLRWSDSPRYYDCQDYQPEPKKHFLILQNAGDCVLRKMSQMYNLPAIVAKKWSLKSNSCKHPKVYEHRL